MNEYIERGAAIKSLLNDSPEQVGYSREDAADCIRYMDAADVAPVQEWVSVKDRLPEESGMYIVTANDGHAQRVSFVQWQKKNRMWNLNGARSYWRVTHWQPMPQPPKGE